MPRRWKPPKEERTDAEALRRKKELAEKLAFAVEYGTEDEFVAAVKKFKPDVGWKSSRPGLCGFTTPAAHSAGFDLVHELVEFLFRLSELFWRHALSGFLDEIAKGVNQNVHRGLRLGCGLCHM